MINTYFVISNSEGDTRVSMVTKQELLTRINENYWGEREYLSEIPDELDTNYWGNNVLIIKGEVVSPVAKEKVIEYEIT
jgi:hypothetical protein